MADPAFKEQSLTYGTVCFVAESQGALGPCFEMSAMKKVMVDWQKRLTNMYLYLRVSHPPVQALGMNILYIAMLTGGLRRKEKTISVAHHGQEITLIDSLGVLTILL